MTNRWSICGSMVYGWYACFRGKFVSLFGSLFHEGSRKKLVLAAILVGVFSHALIQSGPIHDAAQTGDVARVKRFLSRGLSGRKTPQADVNEKDSDGVTPLHIAVQEGHEAVVRLLIESGANKEAQDEDGWTPLHRAVWKGNEVVVCLLIERGAHKEAQDKGELTPLHWAAWKGNEAVARLLLDGGAQIEVQSKQGWTPLHEAAWKGRDAVVQLLLERGATIEAQDKLGNTPLHWAAQYGHEAVARLLIESGANKEVQERSVGATPLYIAAQKGHEAVARLLIESGADKEAQNKDGWTPLHIAAQKGHEAVARLLLDRGASPTTQTIKQCKNGGVIVPAGSTPSDCARLFKHEGLAKLLSGAADSFSLLDAVRTGDVTQVKRLFSRGLFGMKTPQADINEKDEDGWTPLHIAAREGKEAVVRLFIKSGANKEAQGKGGWTPLHIAAHNGQEAAARLLIESGADKEAQETSAGATPLHIAAHNGHEAVVRLLIENGANKETQDEDGWTPLHIAAQFGNEVVARLLIKSGANKGAQGKGGWTPLHIAVQEGHESVARLLLDQGANPTTQTIKQCKYGGVTVPAGSTPSDCARLFKHEGLAKLLSGAASRFQASGQQGSLQSSVGKVSPLPVQKDKGGSSGGGASGGTAGVSIVSDEVPTQETLRSYGITIAPGDLESLRTFQEHLKQSHVDAKALAASASFVIEWQHELQSVAQKEERFAITKREQQALLSHPNMNVGDYYELLWSRLSDTLLACKTMHSGQVANGFENNFETAARVASAAQGVPMVGSFAGIFGSMLGFVAEGQKKRAVTHLATLLHTVGEIDLVTEEVTRCLTNNRMSKLLAMPQKSGTSLPARFKKEWQHFRGDEAISEAKCLALSDANRIIKAIVTDEANRLQAPGLIAKLVQCVDPAYCPAGFATALPVVLPIPVVGALHVPTPHSPMPSLTPFSTPDANAFAEIQSELQALKAQLSQRAEQEEQLQQLREQVSKQAEQAELQRLKTELEQLRKQTGDAVKKLSKKLEGLDVDSGASSQVFLEQEDRMPGGAVQDIFRLQQALAQCDAQLGTHAALLALIQEHPEFKDYLRLTESKPTLSRAEFFSQLDDALQANDGDHLQLLLRSGADLQMRSDANDTVFHRAVLYSAPDCLSQLLESVTRSTVTDLLGARNNDGKTPFQIADEKEDYDVGAVLQPYRALVKGKGRE